MSASNPFAIYITCDTGYPNVHDSIGYSAIISMFINGTERSIHSIPDTMLILNLICDIKIYCDKMSAMILDVSSSEISEDDDIY